MVAAADVSAGPAPAKADPKNCVENSPAGKSEKKPAKKSVEAECKPAERDSAQVKAEMDALRTAAFERAKNALAAEAARESARAAKRPGSGQASQNGALTPPASVPGCIAGCYGRP